MIRALLDGLALSGFTRAFFEGEGGGGGGGGGAGGGTEVDKKPVQKEAKKVELTEEQLEQQKKDAVAAALADERKKTADEKKKADEEAERKKAEEAGKHKDLYEKEKAAREKVESDSKLAIRQKDADIELRDYLSDKHPTYVKSAAYIRPLIEVKADTTDADLAKMIEKAVKKFVEDNPKVGTGSPRQPRTPKAGESPALGGKERKPLMTPIRRGF